MRRQCRMGYPRSTGPHYDLAFGEILFNTLCQSIFDYCSGPGKDSMIPVVTVYGTFYTAGPYERLFRSQKTAPIENSSSAIFSILFIPFPAFHSLSLFKFFMHLLYASRVFGFGYGSPTTM
jgi:hypothetical protein